MPDEKKTTEEQLKPLLEKTATGYGAGIEDRFWRVRLEVDGMKHQIIQHISAHQEQMGRDIAGAIERVVDNFPFEQVVEAVAAGVIREEVERTFKRVVQDVLHSKEVRVQMSKAIQDNVTESLKEWVKYR